MSQLTSRRRKIRFIIARTRSNRLAYNKRVVNAKHNAPTKLEGLIDSLKHQRESLINDLLIVDRLGNLFF